MQNSYFLKTCYHVGLLNYVYSFLRKVASTTKNINKKVTLQKIISQDALQKVCQNTEHKQIIHY